MDQLTRENMPEISEDITIKKSTCRNCHGGCGVLLHIENEKIIKIEGDPEHPMNKGALC
ncbi:MAG: hypothetical protein HOK89_02335, partial [Rhodospirillaceae bacterium]|nr:hypothetical protein [Rhodospirillaceae bacterium]